MNLVRKVFRNSLWLGSAQIGSRGFSILITMILTRYLGTQGFGTYSFIYAYCGIFGILTDIGIDMIIVREASKDLKKAEIMVGNGILLKACFSLAAVFLASVVAGAAGLPTGMAGLILLASLSFLASPFSLYSVVFPARLELQVPALLDLGGRTLSVLLVVTAVLARGSLALIILAILATTVCQTVVTVFVARRLLRPCFRLDFGLWKTLLSEAWPVALNNLLIVLILRVDQIMIERICPDGNFQLGLYSAAVKYCEIYNYLPAIYFASVFPLLSRFHNIGEEAFRNLYTLSFKYLTLIILPIALFSTLFAGQIMTLLFGGDFVQSTRSMQILIWSEPFVFMVWVTINTVVSSGLQRFVLPLAFLAVAVNITLNRVLIPVHGAQGAALASLISYALVLPASILLRTLRPLTRAFVSNAVRPALGIFLLAVLLTRFPMHPLLSALITFVGFFVLMILLGVLTREDLALASRIVARGKGTDDQNGRITGEP